MVCMVAQTQMPAAADMLLSDGCTSTPVKNTTDSSVYVCFRCCSHPPKKCFVPCSGNILAWNTEPRDNVGVRTPF